MFADPGTMRLCRAQCGNAGPLRRGHHAHEDRPELEASLRTNGIAVGHAILPHGLRQSRAIRTPDFG